MLRRMKEDVENLPEKEEVVVWVQLTHQQRTYYKALYSNQVQPLMHMSSGSVSVTLGLTHLHLSNLTEYSWSSC